MQFKTSLALATVCWVLAGAACGDSGHSSGGSAESGDGDGDGDHPVEPGPRDDAKPLAAPLAGWQDIPNLSADLNRYFEAFCGREVGCYGGSLEDCRGYALDAYCEPVFSQLLLPGLAECIEALGSASCDQHYLDACFPARKAEREARGASMLVGRGEACDDVSRRCDYDLFCSAAPGECGECVARIAEGKACSGEDQCEFGLYCSQDLLCTPWLATGAACDERFDVCAEGSCESGECAAATPRKAFGAACGSDEQCPGSGFCMAGKCIPPLACGSAALGEPCHYDSGCKAGLACDPYSWRCVDPSAGLGEPCDLAAEQTGCSAFAYCMTDLQNPPVCAARMADGQSCLYPGMSSIECASGFCGHDGKCGQRPAACAH